MFEKCTAKIENNIPIQGHRGSKLTLGNIKNSLGLTIKRKVIYGYKAGYNVLGRLQAGDFIEFDGKFEDDRLEKILDVKIIDTCSQYFANTGLGTSPQKRRYFTRLPNGRLMELTGKNNAVAYGYADVMHVEAKLDIFFDVNTK